MRNLFSQNAIHLGNFLRGLGVYLPYLVYSTFLSNFIPERSVGLVFTGASIAAGVMILLSPHLFARFRTHRTLIAGSLIAALCLAALAFVHETVAVITLYIIAWTAGWMVALALDVILEKIVGGEEGMTGSSRGIFLSVAAGSVSLASLIIAVTLTDSDYWRVFLIAAGAFLLCAYLASRFFSAIPHVPARALDLGDAFRELFAKRSLAIAMGAHFLLQLFFVWTIVYLPLYLYNHAGFSWAVIGSIFSLATFLFVIIEAPVGRLADTRFGEKEFMIAGLALAGGSYIALFFSPGLALLGFAAIILLAHAGGALLEISTETYFFKQVNAADSELIGVFRVLRQVATIAGPLIGSAVLFFAPFEYVFLAFGIVMLCGIPFVVSIKDTR